MEDRRRLHRGDTVALKGSVGTVLRVAIDESWADVGWWNPDGSFGWSKRQHKPELLSHAFETLEPGDGGVA